MTSEWIGRVIDDRYRVEEPLGEGGMGAVFIAEHLKLKKKVALKIIRSALAGDDEIAARFAREAMASAQIEHPHVASAIDYGQLPEGGAYLVLQLVRGQSLSALLEKRQKLTWPEACEIAGQVADALAAAHAAKVVHRDLKPDNILLERREDQGVAVKVLDFGIARIADPAGSAGIGTAGTSLTRIGTVMGTPGYMSPEQAMGEAVDARADLYALGVVLWEMVVGKPPFQAADLTGIVTRQLTETLPSLEIACGDPSVPAALAELVAALLSRSAQHRPAMASDVRDVLRDLSYVPTGARRIPLTGAANRVTGRAMAPTFASGPQSAGFDRRKTAIVIAIGAALLGAVFLAASGDDAAALAKASGKEERTAELHPTKSRTRRSTEPEVAPGPGVPFAAALQGRIRTLLEANERRDRVDAARWIQDHAGEASMPAYAPAVADLQLARTCRQRKDALARIREIGDRQALPAVDRMRQTPTNGCGFLSLSDCLACVRRDLSQTSEALRGPPG